MNRSSVAMLAAALLVAPIAHAAAQEKPAIDFARFSEIYSVSLSPTGDYVALAVPTKDYKETNLQIVSLKPGGKTQVLRFGKLQQVADVLWSDDEQVVLSRAKFKPMKAQPESYGELMTSNITGGEQDTLFAYVPDKGTKRGRRKDRGFAEVTEILTKEPGNVLVRFECWTGECGKESPTIIYKVDTHTGSRQQVERVGESAAFSFDQSGRARILTTWDSNNDPVLKYRPGAGSEWKPMPKSLAGHSIGRATFLPDNNTAYALVSDQGEPTQLYKLDLAAGTRQKLAGRDDVSISGWMSGGNDNPPFAVTYSADKPSLQYLDQTSDWAQLHLAIMKLFPGQMTSIIDSSRDGRKVLFSVWSDRHPGAYYVFDRDAKKVQLIGETKPWINPAEMAGTRPIEFTARDGKKLFAFYTAKGTGPRPMVVLPHGGPFGINDTWGYDSEVQFLASRGYGVLQVEFRGSGGRGDTFEQSGWRQWGGKIQDDIADGVHWAIDNKLADPQKICIYGASFGGYSALMNPIRNPGLYKCAIGYAGVYDLALLRATKGRFDTDRTELFFDKTLGTDGAMLADNSPAKRAGEVKVPVMLVHGEDDRNANINQYKAMLGALQEAGNAPETFVLDGEGHGFYSSEHTAELFDKMEAFLDRYIGPGANK